MDLKAKILQYFPQLQTLRFIFQRKYKSLFVFLRYLPGSSKSIGPPRGFYPNIDHIKDEKIAQKIHFNDEISFKRLLPITQSNLVKRKFHDLETVSVCEKNGYVLYNARYYDGDGGLVITKDDKIFIPCSPLKNEWYPEKHQAFYRLKLPSCQRLDKVILIDSRCANSNYAHWMMDLLPRFLWLDQMVSSMSEYSLVINAGKFNFHDESLKLLIEKKFIFKEVIYSEGKSIMCNELVVPPYCTYDLDHNKWSRSKVEINFLQRLIPTPPGKVDYNSKIYISRRRSLRTFDGEIDVIKRLEKIGYQEIFLEDLSIICQAHLFRNAEYVIGLHGAGFTNLCFCKKNTKVLEIFAANFIVSDFWSIANINNLDYYAYCEDDAIKEGIIYRVARQLSINVRIDSLFDFIIKYW